MTVKTRSTRVASGRARDASSKLAMFAVAASTRRQKYSLGAPSGASAQTPLPGTQA